MPFATATVTNPLSAAASSPFMSPFGSSFATSAVIVLSSPAMAAKRWARAELLVARYDPLPKVGWHFFAAPSIRTGITKRAPA